jgi:CRP-like cAMP-binding protein
MATQGSQQGNDRGPDSVASAPRALTELAGTRLFEGLDQDALKRLVAVARRVELGPGEMIFSQGDPATAFFLLVRGQVKVFKLLRDGRTATLRYARPGDTFAESALTVDRYPAYTETTAPCVMYQFPVQAFRDLLLAQPQLALEMLGRTTQLMSLLNRRIEELLLPVPARLARFLLELSDEQLHRQTRDPSAAPAAGPSPQPDPPGHGQASAGAPAAGEPASRSSGAAREQTEPAYAAPGPGS